MRNAVPPVQAPNSYDLYEDVEYNEYWKELDKQKLNELEHAIVSELLPLYGRRLIDLGCGYGRLADCYFNRFETIVMFDGSLSLLRAAQINTNGKATYILGDINHLPFRPSAFDSALMVRVFHHIDDSSACIKSTRNILCGGGNLIMNYSNKRNAYRMIKFLMRSTPHNPFTTNALAIEPNFVHHHPDYIAQLLTAEGFDISQFRGAGVFDKLFALTPSLSKLLPSGVRLAPMLGKSLLAPWIFLKGVVQAKDPLMPASKIDDLLLCPICGSEVIASTSSFECRNCRKTYPAIDGIIDMRAESKPGQKI